MLAIAQSSRRDLVLAMSRKKPLAGGRCIHARKGPHPARSGCRYRTLRGSVGRITQREAV